MLLYLVCFYKDNVLLNYVQALNGKLHQSKLEPSKQWVHILHFGSPIALTTVSIELNRNDVSPSSLANAFYHRIIFGRVGGRIFLKVFSGIAFKLLDDAACNQLHLALGGREINVLARIDKRRAADTYMHFFCATFKEVLYIVTKLCATDYRVITEYDTLVIEQRPVRDKLHFCYKLTALLCAWGETSGPRWGVFYNASLVWHILPSA